MEVIKGERQKEYALSYNWLWSSIYMCIFLLERCFFNKCDILYSWYRVQDVEEDIDVLILGNSHAFTSTNAAVLEEAMNERGGKL